MRLVIHRSDGGISITNPVPSDPDSFAKDWEKSFPATCVSWELVKEEDIPIDRTNRDAWEVVDGKIVVNSVKAMALAQKEVSNNVIR